MTFQVYGNALARSQHNNGAIRLLPPDLGQEIEAKLLFPAKLKVEQYGNHPLLKVLGQFIRLVFKDDLKAVGLHRPL